MDVGSELNYDAVSDCWTVFLRVTRSIQFVTHHNSLKAKLNVFTGSASVVKNFAFALACAVVLFSPSTESTASAQENRNQFNLLLLPTSREALTKVHQNCQLWSEKPLQLVIDDVQAHYQIPIWIDRRIDKEQAVSLTKPDSSSTLGGELSRISLACGVKGGLVENVYVLAPANRLARIQRSAVVLHGQLSSSNKSLTSESRELDWPEITSSVEMLQIISQVWNVEFDSASIPHDLWHAGKLPPCSLATQLALLLSGFDLQAVMDTKSTSDTTSKTIKLKIVPLSEETAWPDSYQRTLSPAAIAELRTSYPAGTIEQTGKNTVKIRGETNLHLDVLSPPKPKRTDKTPKEQLLTFELAAPVPVEAVLNNLSQKLGFTIVWSDECTSQHRSRLIELKVKDSSPRDLINKICEAAQLRAVDQEKKFTIYPK